jgi:hypothetical protein
MVPRWLVQVLHPPQKFERPPFWNAWAYRIKKYGVEVTFNGIISLLHFIKIYQLVQKLLGRDRQTGDLISLTFIFKESRLKNPRRSSLESVNFILTIMVHTTVYVIWTVLDTVLRTSVAHNRCLALGTVYYHVEYSNFYSYQRPAAEMFIKALGYQVLSCQWRTFLTCIIEFHYKTVIVCQLL